MAMSAAKRQKMVVEGVRRWRHRMRKQGRCIDCGKKAAVKDGKPLSRCRPHLDICQENTEASRTHTKGLCWCGTKVGRGERDQPLKQCPRHHKLALARSRRYRPLA
jgi:hypothetical protein